MMSILYRMLIVLVALSLMVAGGSGHAASDGGGASETLYLPWVGSRVCDQPVAPTLFGVQMYNGTGADSPYIAELRESGATWMRVPVSWRAVEPANTNPASYNWQSADSALAAAQDACLNVIATHGSAPAWAADVPDGPVRKQNLQDLAEYMADLVERYDGDGKQDAPGSPVVRYWELYNEPDAAIPETGWGNAPARYAAMLKVVYPAIKKASPKAKVLIGGLAYDDFQDQGGPFSRTFLRDVAAAGGGDYFDIMNFHAFPAFAPNWTTAQGPGLLQKTQAVRGEMSQLGLDQPIMITESGHFVDGKPGLESSPELQMRYVAELYAQAMAANVEALIWFSLNDLDPAYYDHVTGLVTRADPPRKRPAYRAYQFAAQQLGTATFHQQLVNSATTAAGMEVYEFRDQTPKRTIYVAWLNPVQTTATKPLLLAGAQAVMRDALGASTLVRDGDDGVADGRVTVQVGGRPVYVEME